MALLLNTIKIKVRLAEMEKNQTWLAQEMGVTKSTISHYMMKRPVKAADKIAPFLKVEPIDLVIQT